MTDPTIELRCPCGDGNVAREKPCPSCGASLDAIQCYQRVRNAVEAELVAGGQGRDAADVFHASEAVTYSLIFSLGMALGALGVWLLGLAARP